MAAEKESRVIERQPTETNRSLNRTIWIQEPTVPIENEFDFGPQLGKAGQYGVTFRCTRKSDGKAFAVKKLSKTRFYRIQEKHRVRYLKSMRDEIEILSTLDHPNIVQLEKVYEDKPNLYLVMELCTGGELIQRIIDRKKYTEIDAAYVMKQMFTGLKYMHEENKIVHCDLKPENIMFLNKDERAPLKIIDFGMSKVLPRLQQLTQLCGTPYYTAPEIIKNKKYNHQCDVWSAGVIMFVMLFGYPPFLIAPNRYGKREHLEIYRKVKRGFIPKVRDTQKYGYGPWFPNHIPVSTEARDLLAHLLESEVAKRYTASDALNHPWILNLATMRALSNKDIVLPSSILTSLAKFYNTCQFKLTVIRLFRDQFVKMRPHHFASLEKIFQTLDTNGDGVVTYEEFQKAILRIPGIPLEQKHVKEMFSELNVEQLAGIRFEDLLNAMVHDYLVACDERLFEAFQALDDDDDGFITTEELKNKLKETDALGEWDRALEIIKDQSLDHDGKIDFHEFLTYLHPNFEEPPEWLQPLRQMTSLRLPEKKPVQQQQKKASPRGPKSPSNADDEKTN